MKKKDVEAEGFGAQVGCCVDSDGAGRNKMTKREICERLWDIANGLSFARGEISSNADVYKAIEYATNAVDFARNSICDLFLDVAAPIPPKTFPTLDVPAPEEEVEVPKAEVPIPETPLLWVDGNAPLSPCPKCGANCPKLDKRTSGLPGAYHYCQSCHAYFVDKRGEGTK